MAVKLSPMYRVVPVAARQVSAYELISRRFNEELDEKVTDLQEYFRASHNKLAVLEPNGRLLISQSIFLDLYELERAKNREEKFSRRKRFKQGLQKVNFLLFSPQYRINYYFLKAKYYRISKKLDKALKLFNVCEKIASETGHVRIMFEIQYERSRIYKILENKMQMKIHLVVALEMAMENQWYPTIDMIVNEFGEAAETLLTTMGGAKISDGAELTQQRTRMDGRSLTQMGIGASTVQATVMSSAASQTVAHGSLENDSKTVVEKDH